MFRYLITLFLLLPSLGAMADDVFLPSDDCFPDPVMDSLTVEKGRIYVEDHVITSGELSYVMHKVNPVLYEKRKTGQKIYLISVGGAFVGFASIFTGSYWKDHYSGSRRDIGRGLLASGIPILATSACTFTWGVSKAHSAKKQFLRNCFGLASVNQIDVKPGVGGVSFNFHF